LKIFIPFLLICLSSLAGKALFENRPESAVAYVVELEVLGIHRVLGPMKSFLADLAWVEVFRHHRSYQYELVDEKTRWICALQPHVVKGWDYLSWNLSFNLFAEAGENLKKKEKWLRRGIEQLDLGLSLNPDSSRLLYSKAVTFFIRSKDPQVFSILRSICREDPHAVAANLGVRSRMLELGSWPESTMVIGMLQKAGRYQQAIAACIELENRFPNQKRTLENLIKLFTKEKNAGSQ